MRLLPAILTALLFTQLAVGQSPDVFKNPTAGFQLTKPTGWSYATADQNAANLKGTKLNDQEFQAAMLKYASAPLVILTKHPEPYPDLNPSLKVNIRPLGQLKGRPATEIINLILPQLERAFKDFQIAQPPTEVSVSGLAGAYVRVHYTLQTAENASFPTASELWIVPRGDFFFMIGAGTRQDEKTGTRAEIASIIQSVKIEH